MKFTSLATTWIWTHFSASNWCGLFPSVTDSVWKIKSEIKLILICINIISLVVSLPTKHVQIGHSIQRLLLTLASTQNRNISKQDATSQSLPEHIGKHIEWRKFREVDQARFFLDDNLKNILKILQPEKTGLFWCCYRIRGNQLVVGRIRFVARCRLLQHWFVCVPFPNLT